MTTTPATDRAWVATRKGLFELRQRGGRGGAWQVERLSFTAEPVTAVLPPDAQGRMFAALNLGHFGPKLHASDDAGATWHEVGTPTYPPQPEGATGYAWKLVQLWALERDAAGRLWAGTLPGGLFCSSDQGQTWTLNQALWTHPSRAEWMGGGNEAPGLHSVCPHPTRAEENLVAVSCGGVWATQDDGGSWAPRTRGLWADFMPPERAEDPAIQDPHLVRRCTAVPEVLWCQHHCGIWRSTDSGGQWQRLHTGLSDFGFAVAAHPSDPLTAWFAPGLKDEQRIPVGAALAVTRTRDGGQTFQALREGLPQQHCYDLVFRHGLDVAADGEQLLMGSSTGHLWATGNGGDHWTLAQAHLPPIYALRFG